MGSQAIELLWAGVYLLGGITLLLLTIAVFTRTIKKWGREHRESKKKEYSTILIGYLTGNISLDKFEIFIKNHPDSITALFEVCNDLQRNLKGTDKKLIQRLLSLEPFINYYLDLLESGRERKIMEALIFLRELETMTSGQIGRIRTLLGHRERYIVHAAAVAIMASEDVKERAYALKALCRDEQITRLALYEVLYRFRKRDREQWLEEGTELTLIITDPAVPLNHRASIAIAMGGMGYYYHSRYLLDLLKNIPVEEKNIPFLAALIEGLGMLHYPEAIVEIQRLLLLTNSHLIIRASIRALSRIDGKDGLEILFRFLSQKYDLGIQIETAIQIINVDVLYYEWISDKFFPEDANPIIVKQIIAEIGMDNFVAGI
jgi:hypothetical protein